MDATIIIPTKNAGPILDRVLSRVFAQKTKYSYEVLCVDSGSTDNTLTTIRRYPCRLYEIDPSEFGHGKTRNFGAQKAEGTFLVFLTQDACPASDYWLQNLLDAMRTDDHIAGGFGKHLPYKNCNLPDRFALHAHFAQFGTETAVFYINDRERFEKDKRYRQKTIFFSDNNACVRRSVFAAHPYPDVDFAEDQIWMRNMLELGWKKVYCPDAPVYHSHNYPLKEYFGRYYDEYKGLWEAGQISIGSRAYLMPLKWAKASAIDVRNILTSSEHLLKKIYWIRYALIRNYYRYRAGWLGSRWHTYPAEKQEKLDRKYSRLYRQVNQ